MDYEPMHSCLDVTDEPCDACICEEDETEQTKNILKRLKKIEEQTKEIYQENADLYDKILENDIKLANFAKEKSDIIKSIVN